MAIKEMQPTDRDYYQKHLEEARSLQDKEFISKIDKDLYKTLYSGRDAMKDSYLSSLNASNDVNKYVQLNKIFPATNRALPTLYYQNPRIVFTARKNASDFSAKILTAVINYDYKEMKIKQENQKVILDAWFTGFGACKIVYQTNFVYKKVEEQDGVKNPDKQEKLISTLNMKGRG